VLIWASSCLAPIGIEVSHTDEQSRVEPSSLEGVEKPESTGVIADANDIKSAEASSAQRRL